MKKVYLTVTILCNKEEAQDLYDDLKSDIECMDGDVKIIGKSFIEIEED